MKYWSKNWFIISMVAVVMLNIALAVTVRTRHVKFLRGKYLTGNDPYLFYRQARMIVKDGKLPQRDEMRYVPIGVNLNKRATVNSYAIAYFYKLCRMFFPSITLEQAAIGYPVVCFTFALIAFTLLVSMTKGNYSYTYAGMLLLFSCLLF